MISTLIEFTIIVCSHKRAFIINLYCLKLIIKIAGPKYIFPFKIKLLRLLYYFVTKFTYKLCGTHL